MPPVPCTGSATLAYSNLPSRICSASLRSLYSDASLSQTACPCGTCHGTIERFVVCLTTMLESQSRVCKVFCFFFSINLYTCCFHKTWNGYHGRRNHM